MQSKGPLCLRIQPQRALVSWGTMWGFWRCKPQGPSVSRGTAPGAPVFQGAQPWGPRCFTAQASLTCSHCRLRPPCPLLRVPQGLTGVTQQAGTVGGGFLRPGGRGPSALGRKWVCSGDLNLISENPQCPGCPSGHRNLHLLQVCSPRPRHPTRPVESPGRISTRR